MRFDRYRAPLVGLKEEVHPDKNRFAFPDNHSQFFSANLKKDLSFFSEFNSKGTAVQKLDVQLIFQIGDDTA